MNGSSASVVISSGSTIIATLPGFTNTRTPTLPGVYQAQCAVNGITYNFDAYKNTGILCQFKKQVN